MFNRPVAVKTAINALLLLVFLSGCSVKKSCSADSQCDEGSFCSDSGKCVEFKQDDYSLDFTGLTDGQTVTTAEDTDRSKEGIQINITVTAADSAGVIKDGTSMMLSVAGEGKSPVIYFGSTVKDKVIFSLVTIPFGEVTISSHVVRNPSIKASIKLNSKNIDIELFYLKNGNSALKTVLQNATVNDDDDFDKITSNGLQISMSASTTGLKKGDTVRIFMPEIQEELITEAVVDDNGEAGFGLVNIPIVSTIRMSVVSGNYSESIEFSVDSEVHCGFLTNLENNLVLGNKDDKNDGAAGLQYDLVISNIAGCGEGSTISVYIDKEPGTGVEPDTTFETASNIAQERIVLEKSKNANDKRKIIIIVEDLGKSLKGSSEFSGILVDLDFPLAEMSLPEAGQTLNMSDDIDSGTPGLQVKFAGTASDELTPPVTVYVKLEDTIISEQSVSGGIFEVEHSFFQSNGTMMLFVTAVDGAGNTMEVNTPFSVSVDNGLKFKSVCGHTDSLILDGMWLNKSDDTETEEDDLQCSVVLEVSEEAGVDEISLKVGTDSPVTKTVGTDNTASFDLSLKDSVAGISLNAYAMIDGAVVQQNNLTVRVDTVAPDSNLTNNLLLNNGESTSALDITFNFTCPEIYCEYNGLLDSETNDVYSTVTSRAVTGLSDGAHSFKLKVRDAAGNIGEQTVFNWTVDSVAPETTITAHPGEGSTNDFALFTFESSKTGSGFNCRLEKEGINFMPADGSWENCNNGKRDYFDLENGNYRFFVRAVDSVGNIDPSPSEHSWVIGTEAPVTTITGIVPSEPVTNINSIIFSYEATVESTFSCKLSKDGATLFDWTDCSSGSQNYSSLEDGSYIFEVRARATYGVEENTPVAYGWLVDTTLPKIRLLSKPAQASPFDSGEFTFECVGESEPCVFECSLDGSVVDCSGETYSYTDIAGGSHRFIVKVTDTAGNKSVAVADNSDEFLNDYTWEIDPAALGVQITSGPDSVSSSQSAVFEFSSNKAAAFECKLDSGNFVSCSSPVNFSALADGPHTFTVKASFGPDSIEDSLSWTIDTAAPEITITNAPDNPTFQTGATFAFSVNETSTISCRLLPSSEWTPCSSPKIFPVNTFGVSGTEQTYTFEIRAADSAGHSSTVSHTWMVDLAGPAIEWISPAPDTNGKILVTKANDIYPGDPNIYAINIKVRISGSDIGKPINVTGFKTPPDYEILYITSTSPKEYTLTLGLVDGTRVNNPLTISVEDNSGNTAVLNKVVVVNTVEPAITWASPEDGYKFLSGGSAPSFIFNVWNSIPGTIIELIDADTGSIVASKATIGTIGTQEYVTITPALSDRCTPYKLYATFLDDTTSTRYYTNSTADFYLKNTRSITVDRTKIAIGTVTVSGVSGTDFILNRADNLNPDPDGGMQTDIIVPVSDSGNLSDNQKIVKIFTDNGSGAGASILVSTLNNISDSADFDSIPFGEYVHTIKVQATDCSGNITTKTLAPITVDSVEPELTLVSPKGSSTNWRWIVAADDPALGTINGSDEFTNIEMQINSNEMLGSYKSIIHTAYNYSGAQSYQSNITSSGVLTANTITIDLPDLEYAKHRFEVTVEDIAGNRKTIGSEDSEVFEVDAISPELYFLNIFEGSVFNSDMNNTTPGFQITLQMNISDATPVSTYKIIAIPVLSQGGTVDDSRLTKTWKGAVTADGTALKDITIGSGWWRISATIKDDHLNQSSTPLSGGFDIQINADVPSIDVLKSTGYDQGEGDSLNGATPESPAWFNPEDINCTDNICDSDIEVWTDAPSGSTAYISLNGGAESSSSTVSAGEKSFADFTLALDTSLEYNTLTVRIVTETSDENADTYYIKVDKTSPVISLINPADCSTLPVCRRIDLVDNPATDVIELAELGFGYGDDSVYGGVLNFKPASSIQFEIAGAEDGTVEVESVSGIVNGLSGIEFDSISGIYYASFENMTVADTNGSGQKNYDLIFRVTESPSGAVARYLVKLHLDLVKPAAINITGKVTSTDYEGKVKIDWVAIQGNNSPYGINPGAVYEYDVRYQDYSEGICSINTNFDSAKKPLTAIAGDVPDPMVGEMSYTFYLNRINNGKTSSDPLFRESDTHKNGDSYCFAVRAVDAVYAEDGTILALNKGSIIAEDQGKIELPWYELRGATAKSHFTIIRNLGDLDGDTLDDFALSDSYRSSNGIDNDFFGSIQIYFTGGVSSFERTGTEVNETLGIGISDRADFNGDGYLDFSYTNADGMIFVHYGSSTGLNDIPGTTFTAKDGSYQAARTMATGDYNGDGCDDIAVSAPSVNGSGTARGQVYIYFGRGSECSSEEAIDGAVPDETFEGGTNNDRLGRGEIYSVGDIDNDGNTDLAFSSDTKIFIAYGQDSGSIITNYTLSGFKTLVGRRIGYGRFNNDNYTDVVVADNDRVLIYYGSSSGLNTSPSITINDISPVNYTYPPSVTNFAKAAAVQTVDMNGDGLSDITVASDRGLLIYQTHNGVLTSTPSIFDSFISTASANLKLLMLDYGIVYCDNATDKGSCYILNYGE